MVVVQRTENLPTQWTVFLFYDVLLIKCESRNVIGSHAIIDVIAGYGVCRTRTFIRGADLTFLLQLLPYTYD